MKRRDRDKAFQQAAVSIGADVIELVRAQRSELRAADPESTRAPLLQTYPGGIYLEQGYDEIWLTHAQARRLRKQLNVLYAPRSTR